MLLRGKWRCFLFRKHFSNPSHIYLRSLKPAEDDHFPSAQLSDTRFISHIWLYRAETLMCVSIILAKKKKNDNQAIVSALGVTTKMSYHLPSHPPHSFFIFSFGSAARAEMSTYTTQMMVNDARSRRILVRCRLTPRLKHAWLGCRAVVREDLKPKIPGSGRPRQSGDFGLRPNFELRRYASPVSLLVSITSWIQTPFNLPFFPSPSLSFLYICLLLRFGSRAILCLSSHVYRTSLMPCKVYTTRFMPQKPSVAELCFPSGAAWGECYRCRDIGRLQRKSCKYGQGYCMKTKHSL